MDRRIARERTGSVASESARRARICSLTSSGVPGFMDTQDHREHTTLGMERVIHIVR